MLRKVRVMDNGSTDILPGTLMDISDFEALNETALLNGEMPATGRPVLMGITKASLETNSFLSAASFKKQLVSLLMPQFVVKKITCLV